MPGYLPSANQSLRANPRHLQWIRKKERDKATQALSTALEPFETSTWRLSPPLVLGFERRTCRLMDVRNLVAAYKALEDAVVEQGLIEDDTPDIVVASPCRQVRVRKRALQGTLLVLASDTEEWRSARNVTDSIFDDPSI
jgi:F0F1-type ATP synthase beta subunit